MGGCSCSCQSEPLEGPLWRFSHPGAPRLGIQVNRQRVFPSKPRNFQRDPGSLDLSYRAKGRQGMCARGCNFPFDLETLLSSPSSGITTLKKGNLRNTFPGAWDRKLAGWVKCDPPSGKKRQQAVVCLPASLETRKLLIQWEASS